MGAWDVAVQSRAHLLSCQAHDTAAHLPCPLPIICEAASAIHWVANILQAEIEHYVLSLHFLALDAPMVWAVFRACVRGNPKA